MIPVCGRALGGVAVALLVLTCGGCLFVTDLFNPALASQLGLGSGASGVIIVAFNYTTGFPATMQAYESRDAGDLTRDSRNFSAEVTGGSIANEVVECPVEVVAPGSLGAEFAAETLAATVITDTATVEVNYAGPPVTAPDFLCDS